MVDERGLRRQRYWTLDAPPAPDLSADECGERFAALLRAAVAGRLRTDWPVGALLSGGEGLRRRNSATSPMTSPAKMPNHSRVGCGAGGSR